MYLINLFIYSLIYLLFTGGVSKEKNPDGLYNNIGLDYNYTQLNRLDSIIGMLCIQLSLFVRRCIDKLS